LLSKTDAVVLRRLNYGNTSRILVFYSRRYGQLRLIAKGVRRRAKKRAGEVEPQLFSGGELVFYPSRSGGLSVLKEWYEMAPRPGFAGRSGRYYSGCYVAEVVEALSREGEPSAGLHALVVETLDAISTSSRCETIVSAFELSLLRELGLAPETGRCTVCGRTRGPERTGRVLYSPVEGGAVCSACAPRLEGPTVRLTAGAVGAMEHLARTGPGLAGGVTLKDGDLRLIRKALTASISSAIEREPRTIRHATAVERKAPLAGRARRKA